MTATSMGWTIDHTREPITMADTAENMASRTGLRMGANVPSHGTQFHLPGGASAGVRPQPKTEDEELGAQWGTTPKAAHTLKIHAARRAADVIRLRRAKGEHDAAASYARPLEDVMAALPCPEPEKREEISDGMEDVRQGEWRANPCEQTLRALLRVRAADRQASLDLDRKLVEQAPAEWGVTL